MAPVKLLDLVSLSFAAYWHEWAGDFDILVRCGRIQDQAREYGRDTPSGWFDFAARAYSSTEPRCVLAQSALYLAAYRLGDGKAH